MSMIWPSGPDTPPCRKFEPDDDPTDEEEELRAMEQSYEDYIGRT